MKNLKYAVALYEELTQRGLLTKDELSLASALIDTLVKTLENCLWVRHSYKDLSQLIEEEA